MRLFVPGILSAMLAAVSVSAAPPVTKRVDHSDSLHGRSIADPYRWLEDGDSPEGRAWIAGQNRYARSILDPIPGREKVQQRLTALLNYTRGGLYNANGTYAGALKRGGRLFFLRQDGLQNQPVIYVQETGGTPRELINPNTLSKEGVTAISSWAPSPDGKLVAYGIAKAGSDWQEWRVRDAGTGKDRADLIEWIKFATPEWSAASDGIYYKRYATPKPGELLTARNENAKLYFHKLGAKQADDTLVWERPDQPEWSAEPWVSNDGGYVLFIEQWGTRTENRVSYRDLKDPAAKRRDVVAEFRGAFTPLGNQGSTVYFWTTAGAPRGRIVAIDLSRPAMGEWREIVPESRHTLEQVVWSAGHFICQYLEDAKTAVRIHDRAGKLVRTVKLPGAGSAYWSLGEPEEKEQFYTFLSFTQPNALYRYDWESGESTPLFRTALPFDPAQFESRQVFYQSKDGTRIPMFVTHRKGLKLDGGNPTLLYGYGGFNIALRPQFSVATLAWIEMGGVYAMANLRGGGEYGDEWHKAGMLKNKQNVFDDFIAAGEWLVANKYTRPAKLAIQGGSNGGLLVGAVLNQRPDLFGAALPMVGVMDMLRFHKFTIGKAWTSDYGDPDTKEDFDVLLRYSPLHNIRKGTAYPATMVMTADHDDRVVPAHSFKYAAALQAAQEGKAPILIRIATSAGHGAGKPTSKQIEEATDVLSFLRFALQMP